MSSDLLAVELSSHDAINVVDRSLIKSILSEQKLAAFGVGSETLLLGHLSGVDTFVMWTEDPDGHHARMVLLDARQGIRIADRRVPAFSSEGLSAEIADLLAANAEEAQKPGPNDKNSLVSIIAVRNVDLPPERQGFIEDYIRQFETAVTQHKRLRLAERTQLRYVVHEQFLPLAARQAEVLSAAVQLTFEFSQAGVDSFNVKCLYTHIENGRSVAYTFSQAAAEKTGKPTKLADNLDKLLTQLPVSQTTKVQERQRMVEEGYRLLLVQEYQSAATCYFAAYALGESSRALIGLSTAMSSYLQQTLFPPNPVPEDAKPWQQMVSMANDFLLIKQLIHEDHTKRPAWPFYDYPNAPKAFLSPDINLHLAIPFEKLSTQPDLIAEATPYVRDYANFVMQHVAEKARAKLTGGDLDRFNAELAAIELDFLSNRWSKEIYPDWEERLFAVFGKNLSHDHWTRKTLFYQNQWRTMLSRQQLSQLLATPRKGSTSVSSLAVRYLSLGFELGIDGDQTTPVVRDPEQIRALAHDLVEAYASCADTVTVRHPTISVMGITFQLSEQQHAVGMLLDATISLEADLKGKQKLVSNCFLELLRRNRISPHLLQDFVHQAAEALPLAIEQIERDPQAITHGPALLLALRQKIVQAKEAEYQAAGISKALSVPLAWSNATRIPTPNSGNVPRKYLNLDVDGEDIYLQTMGEHRDTATVSLYVDRKKTTVDAAWEQVQHITFSRTEIERGVATLRNVVNGRPLPHRFFTDVFDRHRLAIAGDYVVVPTAAGGIIVMPRNGEPSFVIDTKSGLPSNYVQAVVCNGRTVYAWVGERSRTANFVAVDIPSRKVDLLASCQRAKAMSPLDNFTRGECRCMTLGKDNSVVMAMTGASTVGQSGLWAYFPQTGEFKQLERQAYKNDSSLLNEAIAIANEAVENQQTTWRSVSLSTYQASDVVAPSALKHAKLVAITESGVWWQKSLSEVFREDKHTKQITGYRTHPESTQSQVNLRFLEAPSRAILIGHYGEIWIASGLRD